MRPSSNQTDTRSDSGIFHENPFSDSLVALSLPR